MKHRLAGETKETLEAILRDVAELLEEPVHEVLVHSEGDLRSLVKVTGRPRALLVREMERAEAVRSRAAGRAFDPPPTLGSLLRLARLEVRAAMGERGGS